MPASTTVPISSTNVETMIDTEDAYGVVNAGAGIRTLGPHGKIIAYDSNTLSRAQALLSNNELRGIRQSGTRVVGPKNPGGGVNGHMTDVTLPLMWYGAVGAITTSVQLPTAPVVALVTVSGLIEAGAHSYKIQHTRPNGTTSVSAASNTVTTDGAHGKVTIPLPVRPTGWTTAIFRSAAGNAVTGPWLGVTGAGAIAANVTSFLDNIADSALSGATAAVTNSDQKHVITPWNGDGADTYPFPSFTIQRKLPYIADAAAYKLGLGAQFNKVTVAIKGGTGFYDLASEMLLKSFGASPLAGSYDAAPTNWRNGEKIHHAMVTAAKMLVDGQAWAKNLEGTITHSNNLATDDQPMGGGGDRGSSIPLDATTGFTGTAKVTDPSVLSLVEDGGFHTISSQWDFATLEHYHLLELFGVQFDPVDEQVQGQGMLKISQNGMASQPVGGNQIKITVVNDQPLSMYIGLSP
jgi:hypothetical protein